MLKALLHETIHDINPKHWDEILVEADFFHRHRFIRIVEDSKVENAAFSYLLVYDEEVLVATAVFSAFYVNLDLFIGKNGFIKGLKKVFPNLFRIKLLACGLPASFGQLNIKIIHARYADAVAELVAGQLRILSKKWKTSLLTVKEFREEEKNLFARFSGNKFFLANSIPYMNMNVCWNSFEEYLNSLRHSYRRKILLSLKKIRQEWLQPGKPDPNRAEEFYKMYIAVMERTAVKLEVLNLEFFRNLFRDNRDLEMLNLVVDGKIISSAVLIFTGRSLTFMLAGRVEEKDKYDSYFNLVYGIIALAIKRGCDKIQMGQTSYWVKQCAGALPEPEYIYFASRRPVVHRILKSLRNIIFPEMKIKPIHVFRDPPGVKESPVLHEQLEYCE